MLGNGTADMRCCFCDGYGKEVGREKKNYKDRQETARVLEELTKQYPDDERPAVIICNVPRPVVIVDDVADVMQRAPA